MKNFIIGLMIGAWAGPTAKATAMILVKKAHASLNEKNKAHI